MIAHSFQLPTQPTQRLADSQLSVPCWSLQPFLGSTQIQVCPHGIHQGTATKSCILQEKKEFTGVLAANINDFSMENINPDAPRSAFTFS